MIRFLKAIDIYGSQFFLNIEGRLKNKTVFGGLSTIVSLACLTVVIILFGNDFFFRLNPRILDQKQVDRSSELIIPTTANYTVAYRVENYMNNRVDLASLGVKFTAFYRYFAKNEAGVTYLKHYHEFEMKRCKDIPAVANTEIDTSYNLQQHYCVDWDEITDFVPYLGGFWDEDKTGYITFHVNFCSKKGEEDCASLKKMREIMNGRTWYFSAVYPNFFFDAESFDDPVKRYFEANPLEISAYTGIIQDARMQMAYLVDDKGWIFKDETTYSATTLEYLQSNFTAIIDDDIGNFKMMEYCIYFGKVTQKIHRSFVKVQELAAEVGGIIKLVHLLFTLVASYYSKFDMMRDMQTKLSVNKPEVSRLSSSNVNINNTVKTELKSEIDRINFFQYCFRFCYKREHKKFSEAVKKIEKQFDVYEQARIFNEIQSINTVR